MTKAYKKYTEYKDSGIDWLGEIPSHWEVRRNKYIFQIHKELVGKKSNEYDLLSLTLNGIIKRDMVNPQGKFPAEFDTYQEVRKGNFVFCLFDIEETPRTIGLSNFDGMITGAYTVLGNSPNFCAKFLYYFYLNLDNDKRMRSLYKGLRNTISKENFLSFSTFSPPLSEQEKIAEFLDKKTKDIDTAIAQKEQLIELLKERKQILINKAVTRGLNPDAELKDSGIDWIGSIPKHWEVRKLKYCASLKGRLGWKGLKADEYVSDGYGFLSTPDIKNDIINFDSINHITEARYFESPEIMLKKRDILLVKDGSTLGIVNLIKELPIPSTVNSSIGIIRVFNCDYLCPEFLLFLLKSNTIQITI